uniref:Uncharacterized protein n=1 Tax=Candidatus Kentrum sp. FW TaxID=2126338 RepID=A0A450U344_9GAMM|nr:MAG: hypothetical protein BECKFW1821C_GA0114237_112911 [Candidatus Kentron sp. FW]
MTMKFSDIPHAFRIAFENQDAGWALCIIDDKSDAVKPMVMGSEMEDIEGNPVTTGGLGQDCADPSAVYGYWKRMFLSAQETRVRTH